MLNQKKGLIALDIDGTLTADAFAIPQEVIDYLHSLSLSGWEFMFITGRPFQWSYRTLQILPFPFLLAIQNGAIVFELPSKKILKRHYLKSDILPQFEAVCKEHGTDFVIYSGYENSDYCYYRPSHLPADILKHVEGRRVFLGENWHAVETFEDVPVDAFASIKCFVQGKDKDRLSKEIENRLGIHAPPIRDTYGGDFFVIQATRVNKGEVLQEYLSNTNFEGPVIAAGDDNNDIGMLKAAHFKIAMGDAPQTLLSIADFIAPTAAKKGLLVGLNEAIEALAGSYERY